MPPTPDSAANAKTAVILAAEESITLVHPFAFGHMHAAVRARQHALGAIRGLVARLTPCTGRTRSTGWTMQGAPHPPYDDQNEDEDQ